MTETRMYPENVVYTDVIKSVILPEIEKKYDITILLAVESGSRMWGFASPDSDYDVRFIYRRNRITDYFSVASIPDTIEWADTTFPLADCCGWDITKTIQLMGRGNASVIEWLQSPIVYAKNTDEYTLLRMLQIQLLASQYIKTKIVYHYSSLLNNAVTVSKNQCDDPNKFLLKKFLYAARAALMVDYMKDQCQSTDDFYQDLPPVVMTDLLGKKSDAFRESIDVLIDLKRHSLEKKGIINPEDFPYVYDLIEHFNNRKLDLPKTSRGGRLATECDLVLHTLLPRN